MKKTIVLLVFLSAVFATNAQTTNDEIEYIQAIFGMEKRAAVKDFIVLEDAFKDDFWRLYDEYEFERKDYGKQRIQLLDRYVDSYDKMTDKQSDVWMKSVISLRQRNEKLIETYYKKIRKVCSPTVAMQFYQIESYLLAGIRFQILESVPF